MNWLQRAAGATQELFYRWVQPSRDRSRAPICVGTSALYRRAALDRSGGFALIGHSEDVHTGVNMMRVGFSVRYVPDHRHQGPVPRHVRPVRNQQYRWCTGSMSLLVSPRLPSHRPTISSAAELLVRVPLLHHHGVNVFAMALPVDPDGPVRLRSRHAGELCVRHPGAGRQAGRSCRSSPLERESLVGLARIQTTYSFCHALALYDVLRGRTDSWVATGAKVRSRTAERVRRLIRWWCVSVQALLWLAIAWHTPHTASAATG